MDNRSHKKTRRKKAAVRLGFLRTRQALNGFQIGFAASAGKSARIGLSAKIVGLFWRRGCVIEPAKSTNSAILERAPERRGISHESRNSSELSYNYGRHD